MIEVRRNKVYAPKLANGKVKVNAKGKPELIPMMVRQAYIPDEVGIDGVRGYIVSCRKRDSNPYLAIYQGKVVGKGKVLKELETKFPYADTFIPRMTWLMEQAIAQKTEFGWTDKKTQWWMKSQIDPQFSISILRDTPPDTMMVKWAQCPGGVRPKWGGVTSTAIPLRLRHDNVHQKWFAVEDEKIVGSAEIRKTLERQFPEAQYVYGYMEPTTISAEKRLKTANEVSPGMTLIGDKFVDWAAKFVGGKVEALKLVETLLLNEKTE